MRFYNKKWSVLFFLLELSCCCVVQSIVLRSFTGWSLPGRERGRGQTQSEWREGVRKLRGGGAGGTEFSVCVWHVQQRPQCFFIQEKGCTLTCICYCCYSYTASGFSCKRLFAAGRVTSVLSKGLDSCWRTWSHHFISLDRVQGKSWVFLC